MIHPLLLDEQERNAVEKVLSHWANKSKMTITLDSLIKQWAGFVRSVERGYNDSIYEYTNDLSVRDILADVLASVQQSAHLKIEEVLKPWDERFTEATRGVKRALAPGIKKDAPTWWFRVPKNLTRELEEDLRSEGILE